ncbi:AAA family ATPase [Catenulispora pinisilvae]|uniref:AAA family ATPase n=1 Tax=Catenulispora pinisilvae TaxID=2705253 RepID=UPI002B27092D|nr:AAA family ATPase [Catenulispora pinisilvae]
MTQVARALSASGGAVGNALMALAVTGYARMTSESPRRFRATELTAAVASAAPVAGPAPARRAKPVKKAAAKKPAAAASTAPALTPTAPATVLKLADMPKPGPITRPNGQTYHPRVLSGHPDVNVLRALRNAGIPAMLYGPPGTGKTSMVEAAFDDLITVAGDNETSVGDLLGEYTQNPDGTYSFAYGPVVRAMREGRALLIDDATLIDANVLAALYSCLDGRQEVVIKAHKGEVVTAADGFYVCAGHNPGAHGAILTEALASRFYFTVKVSSDWDVATHLGVAPTAITVAKNLAKQAAAGEVTWHPNLRELLGFAKVAEVLGEQIAFANLVGSAPVEDRDTVAQVVSAAIGRPVAALALGTRI